MPLRVKLCGVRRVADALVCAEAGADEIGVIFAPSSKRKITHEEGAAIRTALPAQLPLVGVFKDATLDEIVAAQRASRLSAVQLHGLRPAGIARDLRSALGSAVKLIAAVHVRDADSLAALAEVTGFDRVLLDGPQGGGSGTSFDWALVPRAREHFRGELFLAGGLTSRNVAQAIRAARPDGVDVASGIEGADGFKDPTEARAFVAAARSVNPEGA